MSALGRLSVLLDIDAAQFTSGIEQAERDAKAFSDRVVNAFDVAAKGAAAIGTAALGAAVALTQIAKGIGDLQDIAEKIGDSATNVASLKAAADVAGVGLNDVAGYSTKLTAALSKTDDESKGARKALVALGVDLKQFESLSQTDRLKALADAFSQYEDGAGKSAAAIAILGKSGAEALPFLNDLAEVGLRQTRLTEGQIAAANAYGESLSALQGDVGSLAQEFSARLVPDLQSFVDLGRLLLDFLRNSQLGSDILAASVNVLSAAFSGLRKFFETIIVIGSDVAFVFAGVGREIGAIAAQIAALARGDLSGFRLISEAVTADAQRARAELDKFQSSITNGLNKNPTAGQFGLSLPGEPPKKQLSFSAASGSGKEKSQKEKIDEAQRYLDRLQQQLQKTQDLSVYEQTLSDIQSGRLKVSSVAQQESILFTARQIDEVLALQKALKDQEAQEKQILAVRKQLAEESARELEAANKRSEKAAEDAAKDAARVAGENLKRQQDQIDGVLDQIESLARGGKAAWKKMIDDWIINTLKIKVLKPFLEDIFPSGAGGSSGGGGGLGDFLGGIFSAIGSPFGGARANGGPVNSGRSYLVGERGPEIFSPGSSGAIVPNDKIAARGAITLVSNITLQGGSDTPEMRAYVDRSVEASHKLTMKNLKQAGVL